MPIFEHRGVALHYEEHGHGFPVLLLAPGGMRSNAAFWQRAPYDPVKELAQDFRLISMDQRNAGHSVAPIGPDDGWKSYTEDQLALLDHLGVWRCHVLGMCIGGSFGLSLLEAAPHIVASAVLQQPIGVSATNREAFYKMFDDWHAEIGPKHPEATPAMWQAFRERMYSGDFVFSATREAVQKLSAPLLVLMGQENDVYHPSEISREIVSLAPKAELIERWKQPQEVPNAINKVRAFLLANTPA